MIYKCPFAERRPGKPLLFCKKLDKECANQRFCNVRRETVLTQFAKDCPARKNENPAPVPAPKQKPKATQKKKKPAAAETESE